MVKARRNRAQFPVPWSFLARLSRRWPLPVVALAIALGGAPAAAQAPPGGPPPAVVTAPVESRVVTPSAEFIGRVEAIETFDARARVEGFLQRVAFGEGSDVRAGDLLFEIEPAPYEAALASARAQVSRAEAAHRAAERAYTRTARLRERGTVSEAALDEALAAREEARADIEAGQAAVRNAELNLGYTEIRSPMDGRIGATAVTTGNLVSPSTGVLAMVVQLDPIRVVFSVSDRDLLAVQADLGVQAPDELIDRFHPALRLPNGAEYQEAGHIEFIDNRVDPGTGTVAVRARFANTNKILLPGMFVTVVVQPERRERRPVVPVSAVQQDRDGRYVLVLAAENRAEQRRIKTGPQVGQAWVVEEGLREGEMIIVRGQQKVQPGMTVAPSNETQGAG